MSIIFNSEDIICKSCVHYEQYHQYPNPLAVAKHWCKRCQEEIYVKNYTPFFPKACYFNDYYEESEEHKKYIENKYKVSNWACQVED